MMITNVFTAQEIREFNQMLSSASLRDLENMKMHLREVSQMIDRETSRRGNQVVARSVPVEVRVVPNTIKKPVSKGGTVQRMCDNQGCKNVYTARQADLKRGWGKCCSKSCAASHKLRNNPDHGYLHRNDDDDDLRHMSPEERRREENERAHQAAMDGMDQWK
jgi:hypothetical protein